MKGDFTKLTFQSEKHYTSVLMQQGRLQLDSDWNEQVDIQNHLRHTQTIDLIGASSGVPTSEGNSEPPYKDSFKISVTPDCSDLAIAPGRLYANGILCELEGTLFDFEIVPQSSASSSKGSSSKQIKVSTLNVDGRNLETNQWVEICPDANAKEKEDKKQCFKITKIEAQKMELTLSEPVTGTPGKKMRMRRLLTYNTQPDYPNPDNGSNVQDGFYLAYIDVWQRHITTIEDPKLREVALINTPDTATRSQTVWQLKLEKYDPIATLDKYYNQLIELISPEEKLNFLNFKELLLVADRQTYKGKKSKFEQLIETYKTQIDKYDQFTESLDLLFNKITDYQNNITSLIKEEAANFIAQRKNRLSYMNACAGLCTSAGATSNGRGYQRLENQLYRVEIHNPGQAVKDNNQEKKATFKWSRENGSIVSAIEKFDDNIITIRKSSQDAWTNSQTGQWLEITNEEIELKGKPGVMVRLLRVSDTKIEFDRFSIINGPIPSNATKVRRWDHITPEAAITAIDEWIPLEAGIMVKFSPDSHYETGDYWIIPAKSATNDIEWSNDQADKTIRKPLEQLRQGIHHDYCLLALVEVKEGKFEQVEKDQDLRVVFPPLMRCLDTAGGVITGLLEIRGNVGIGLSNPAQKLIVENGNVGIGYNDPEQSAMLAVKENVGIGITKPNAQLHIAGTVQIDAKANENTLINLTHNEQSVNLGFQNQNFVLQSNNQDLIAISYEGNILIGDPKSKNAQIQINGTVNLTKLEGSFIQLKNITIEQFSNDSNFKEDDKSVPTEKAIKTYVETENNELKTELEKSFNQQINEVKTTLNEKADKNQVQTALNEITKTLNEKVDKNQVQTALNEITKTLNEKVDKNQVQIALNEITKTLNEKVDKNQVQIALNEITKTLNEKVDKNQVQIALNEITKTLNEKVDKNQVQIALNEITKTLNEKADAQKLKTAVDEVAALTQVVEDNQITLDNWEKLLKQQDGEITALKTRLQELEKKMSSMKNP